MDEADGSGPPEDLGGDALDTAEVILEPPGFHEGWDVLGPVVAAEHARQTMGPACAPECSGQWLCRVSYSHRTGALQAVEHASPGVSGHAEITCRVRVVASSRNRPEPGMPTPTRMRVTCMRQHFHHVAGEVQGDQQIPFGQAFKAMHPPRGQQVLQPGTVPLPRPPGEPANRHRCDGRDTGQLLDRTDHIRLCGLPFRRPPPCPPRIRVQPPRRGRIDGVRRDEVIRGAAVRPHLPGI